LLPLGWAAVLPGLRLRPEGLGRTSRKGRRLEGSLWVSREGGGERDGGDTALCVKGKGGLSSKSPAAEKLGHRTVH
jgi:hypothetical protein